MNNAKRNKKNKTNKNKWIVVFNYALINFL